MRPIVIYALLPLSILSFFSRESYAQLNTLEDIFLPNVARVTDSLRAYIRSDRYPGVSHDRNEELRHIDMIFEKGMELSDGKVSRALLAISIAVLNRTSFSPTFPLTGKIRIPLPSEDRNDAAARIRKLPRYFFADSPKNKWGDSAKLVHFFGSAYLTYVTGTKFIPDEIGKWIEEGEATFKLDSLGQRRDVFINRLGQRFGYALSRGRKVLPSDFLRAEYFKSLLHPFNRPMRRSN